jgi:hypothetical protein
MDKLTINELKGYLGTGLQMRHNYTKARHDGEKKLRLWVMELTFTSISMAIRNQDRKPLLYPLSSLTEYREDLGFVPMEELNRLFLLAKLEYYSSDFCNGAILLSTIISDFNILSIKEKLDLLYSWHIDVHNLIDRNLAINIKTLKDE